MDGGHQTLIHCVDRMPSASMLQRVVTTGL